MQKKLRLLLSSSSSATLSTQITYTHLQNFMRFFFQHPDIRRREFRQQWHFNKVHCVSLYIIQLYPIRSLSRRNHLNQNATFPSRNPKGGQLSMMYNCSHCLVYFFTSNNLILSCQCTHLGQHLLNEIKYPKNAFYLFVHKVGIKTLSADIQHECLQYDCFQSNITQLLSVFQWIWRLQRFSPMMMSSYFFTT